MPGKGKLPREEGFLGGRAILQRKWGSECFWGSVLNKSALLTKAKFQKVTQGATYFSTKCKFSDIICSKSNIIKDDLSIKKIMYFDIFNSRYLFFSISFHFIHDVPLNTIRKLIYTEYI